VSSVAPTSVTLSMVMFFAFYVVLLLTFFVLARNWLRTGPDLTLIPPAPVKAEAAAAVTGY
jgi:cytochrome d ubiquinol oxidase subunit I